jgi:GNAT superfamily N-acetyltransferase
MNVSVRRAVAADAAAISEIYALSWKTAYRGIVLQPYLDQLKLDFWQSKFQNWINHNEMMANLLCVDSNPVGCVAYCKARDSEYSDWGEIVSIYMHPDYFRKGYGKMLMDTALKNLSLSGYQDCYLWVLDENTSAQQFYKKNGFTGNGDKCTCEIMGKQLTDLRYIRKTAI